ncbi:MULTISPECIES: DUF2290 domain-containing protein [Lysinibacillus]|uniref:DUF2290 domain-containing protein n=1 Tax=Lysinibacillus TaxID=400634 RepID=UPI000310B0D3|nr:DUF2290 domain-containing protein [Lysinibacillus boronitolerans]
MSTKTDVAYLVKEEIDNIISKLIEVGLCVNQNFTSDKMIGNNKVISWGQIKDLSIVMKNVDYEDIYKVLEEEGNYNIKLIDGSLIQMMYTFNSNDEIISHRLGFFPSINLSPFEKDPEVYYEFDIYADILKKNVLPTIFRFDFDLDDSLFQELDHSKSHLTFGQVENCRIPVRGPISPNRFMDFILRNFYHKAMKQYNICFDFMDYFSRTITTNEENLIYIDFK